MMPDVANLAVSPLAYFLTNLPKEEFGSQKGLSMYCLTNPGKVNSGVFRI